MRISAKGRYALAAAVCLARSYHPGDYTTVLSLSEKLGLSKIYLEQVFSLLKRGGVVISVKGAQGGYQLAREPRQLTVYEVLAAVETALFEPTDDTVPESAPDIEATLRQTVFDSLDKAVAGAMTGVTLLQLSEETEKHRPDDGFMFYI